VRVSASFDAAPEPQLNLSTVSTSTLFYAQLVWISFLLGCICQESSKRVPSSRKEWVWRTDAINHFSSSFPFLFAKTSSQACGFPRVLTEAMENAFAQPVDKVLAHFQADPKDGLTDTQVTQLRNKYGSNGTFVLFTPESLVLPFDVPPPQLANIAMQPFRRSLRRPCGS
jgi:hypothetical protein